MEIKNIGIYGSGTTTKLLIMTEDKKIYLIEEMTKLTEMKQRKIAQNQDASTSKISSSCEYMQIKLIKYVHLNLEMMITNEDENGFKITLRKGNIDLDVVNQVHKVAAKLFRRDGSYFKSLEIISCTVTYSIFYKIMKFMMNLFELKIVQTEFRFRNDDEKYKYILAEELKFLKKLHISGKIDSCLQNILIQVLPPSLHTVILENYGDSVELHCDFLHRSPLKDHL